MSRTVDVECRVIRRNPNSIVVVDGGVMKIPGANGQMIEREIEYILPKGHVEENDDGTITMPEWLAIDRGLA